MGSSLNDITSYWASNGVLTNLISVDKVYLGVAPAPNKLAYPFAVITSISSIQGFTTGKAYVNTFTVQISVYHTDSDDCEEIAWQIATQFDYVKIAPVTISIERRNGPLMLVDTETPKRVYHCLIEYDYLRNEDIGA